MWRWFLQLAAASHLLTSSDWQKALLVAGRELGAFLKTTSPVKSLLFLMCGC